MPPSRHLTRLVVLQACVAGALPLVAALVTALVTRGSTDGLMDDAPPDSAVALISGVLPTILAVALLIGTLAPGLADLETGRAEVLRWRAAVVRFVACAAGITAGLALTLPATGVAAGACVRNTVLLVAVLALPVAVTPLAAVLAVVPAAVVLMGLAAEFIAWYDDAGLSVAAVSGLVPLVLLAPLAVGGTLAVRR